MLAPSTSLSAQVRVGESFEGVPLSWLENRFGKTKIWQGDSPVAVTSRLGDRPAIRAVPEQDGLAIITLETTPDRLTYRDWEKFKSFVKHKDFATALEDHAARGLPETGFVETYTRHVKSLVSVGSGSGKDRAFGLQTEIVALANPYTDDLSNGMPVQVFYLGEPRVDAQVEVFEKQGETVNVFLTRTDEAGRATIPVKPGHSYLLDAVVLRDTGADDPSEGAVWESLWAGLSFATP